MAGFKWTNDLIILLIETYRDLECLWNAKDAKYKCRNTNHDAWSKLSDVTGANQVEVKRKIKNLVGQFFRERKKYQSYKKSGAGAIFVSKWFAYNYMLFLADKNKARRCTEAGLNDKIEDSSSASEHDCETEESISPMSQNTHTLNSSQEDEETEDILANQTPRAGNKRSAEQFSTSQATDTQPGTSAQQVSEPRPPTPQLSEPGSLAQQLPKRFKRDSTSVNSSVSKTTNRKKKNDELVEKRQEEAYKVLKELQYKKLRSRFQIFGEHVGLKIESLKSEYAQNTVEHLISNILWEASIGRYDYRSPFNVHSPCSSGSSNQFQTTPIPQLSSDSNEQYEIPLTYDTVSSRSNNQYEITVISNEHSRADYIAPISTSYSSSNTYTVTENNTNQENNADGNRAAPRDDTFSIIQEAIEIAAINNT